MWLYIPSLFCVKNGGSVKDWRQFPDAMLEIKPEVQPQDPSSCLPQPAALTVYSNMITLCNAIRRTESLPVGM